MRSHWNRIGIAFTMGDFAYVRRRIMFVQSTATGDIQTKTVHTAAGHANMKKYSSIGPWPWLAQNSKLLVRSHHGSYMIDNFYHTTIWVDYGNGYFTIISTFTSTIPKVLILLPTAICSI
mmetsp:Transcript_17768/g.30651  ORF Transcript_17768/g.30651 Transcript_17768/m.30651 type:complete len:120 (+) Transcript_17768:496-855(+)